MTSRWPSKLELLLIFLVSLLCRASGECSADHNLEELQRLRLEQLKNNILAQLGLTEPPEVIESQPGPTPEVEMYQQLETDYSDSKCTSGDFFAKPINSFVGILAPVEGLTARYRRSLEQDVVVEPGVLNQYTITLNFSLAQNMSHISRADLTLYQEEVNTVENQVLDRHQLVQIRTVIGNVRYFVEKKSLDVFDHGPQSFDVKRAVELWLEEGVSGTVVLEVLVTCYSSANCSDITSNGKRQPSIAFTQDHADPSKLPRLITISKNPLDVEAGLSRHKRSDDTETESSVTTPEFCTGNQTTCCLMPLTIHFERDLGFTFVKRPESFTANYCTGYCPEVSGIGLMTSQRYQLLSYLSSSPTSSIEPCCTGLEYRPLQILVSLYNPLKKVFETRVDRLDQVMVTKCRCG